MAGATEDGTCFICAEPITFWSVGVCGHKTCHVCAVRLRTFYKKYECTYCKTVTPSLLFTRDADTPFPVDHHVPPSPADQISAALDGAEKLPKGERWYKDLILPGTLDLEKFPYQDERLEVVFEDEDMMEATLLLLRFNCPYTDCPYMARDWNSLEKHTLAQHGLVICRLCRSQLHRFAHEQTLYPPHLLPLHDPSRVRPGHRPPKPRGEKEIEMVKSWEAPHPLCEFCHEAFFGPDELFRHMRERHDECFVCKNNGERDVYFENYDRLEQHFKNDHYPCTYPQCLEQKFVVFGSEMDLQAHTVSEHGDGMTARDRAQARTLHVDFNSTSDDQRHSGTSRHRGPRGFTIASSSQPSSVPHARARDSAPHQQQISQPPPMAPAQAAQQARQIQVDNDESRRRKAFVTTLTDPYDTDSGLNRPSRANIDDGRRSGFATPREDVDDATAEKHAALLSRVTLLVNDSSAKQQSFRSAVRQFRNNESSANDLVDTVYHVLDLDVDATASIVRETAGIFDEQGDQEKSQAILEALNAFRVKQEEQFPSLGGPSGIGSNWAGITSGKILNAKRATHTSGRGTASRDVWNRVEAAASAPTTRKPPATMGANGRFVPGAALPLASSSIFPSLAEPAISQSSRPSQHSTPWSTGGAGSASKSPSALASPQIRSVNYPTASAGKVKPPSQAAFPSLPNTGNTGLSKSEREALFSKPNARQESIRKITGTTGPPPTTSSWGIGGVANGIGNLQVRDETTGDAPTTPAIGDGPAASGGGGGKKKGKQKQLLFSVSTRP